MRLYLVGHEAVDRLALMDEVADLGAADIEQGRVHQLYSVGQRGLVDGRILPGIDDDGLVAHDVVSVPPSVETSPVVSADDE